MRSHRSLAARAAAAILLGSSLSAQGDSGSSFTYQGQLRQDGVPMNGTVDLVFSLWDSESDGDGGQLGGAETLNAVTVTDGLFTVVLNADGVFDVNAFDGNDRWLQVEVASPSGSGSYTTLTPRQQITAAPYAIHAQDSTTCILADAATALDAPDGSPSPAVYVNNDGWVGIGTTAPTADLHVSNPYGTETVVRLESAVLTPPAGDEASPSTAGPANDFLPFSNVATSDNLYATAGVPINATVQFEATGFGFNLPEAAVVSGIEVRIERKESILSSLEDTSIVLLGGSGSSDDLSQNDSWNSFDEMILYGADNDLWGLSWSPEQINDPAFGVLLAATNDNPFFSATGSIDLVEIEVFYSVVDVQTQQADLRFDLDGLHVDFGAGVESQKLSVGGTIESTTGGFKFPDGTIQTSASAASGLWEQSGNNIFYDAGSVGIGSAGPTMPLSIRGQASGIPDLDNLISLRDTADVERWAIVRDAELLAFQDETGNFKFSLDPSGANVSGTLSTNVLEILGGSDIAEPFDINPSRDLSEQSRDYSEQSRPGHAAAAERGQIREANFGRRVQDQGAVPPIEPGMTVCIDPDRVGELRLSSTAYDTTVAGIISGANGVSPGMTLRQPGTVADGKHPVAMTGRVWCWCDAGGAAIKAGDLLTTSDTPGHAMKVGDPAQANGAVLGKAMSSLENGRGLVLVLVSLQ